MAKNYERPVTDLYPSPDDTIEKLFKALPCLDPYTYDRDPFCPSYMEPCYGTGKIYRHLPMGSQWAEIDMGVDYLNSPFKPVDIIITNPPFSLAQEFLAKSLTEADIVVYLLRLNFLGSKKRQEFWKQNPPTSVVVLSKRPSFTPDGKTDSADYGWFIFDKKNRLKLEPFYFI